MECSFHPGWTARQTVSISELSGMEVKPFAMLKGESVAGAYRLRPGVKVEPVDGFEKGRLNLIEIPTPDERHDNNSLLWEPPPALETGKSYHFHYRLRWLQDLPPSGHFAVRVN